MLVKKGEWVQISQTVLEPSQRAPQVPADTKEVPLRMWVKGYLLEDGEMNKTCKVETMTGRIVEGTLVCVDPKYTHNFGSYVEELNKVTMSAKQILFNN